MAHWQLVTRRGRWRGRGRGRGRGSIRCDGIRGRCRAGRGRWHVGQKMAVDQVVLAGGTRMLQESRTGGHIAHPRVTRPRIALRPDHTSFLVFSFICVFSFGLLLFVFVCLFFGGNERLDTFSISPFSWARDI